MEELNKKHEELNELYRQNQIAFDIWEMQILSNETLEDDDKILLIKSKRGKMQTKMIVALSDLRDKLVVEKLKIINFKTELTSQYETKMTELNNICKCKIDLL